VNRVILLGHLGRSPELRHTGSGQPVATLSLATTERWRAQHEGDVRERTSWHRVVVWDRLAEACAQHLEKGRQVYVEGRIQTREWEGRDGQKRRGVEVVAEVVRFLGRKPQAQGEAGLP
jgi:single-strand DNA-binding protein